MRLVLFCIFLVLVLMSVHVRAEPEVAESPYNRNDVVEAITKDHLLRILKVNGFSGEGVEGKDNLIRLTISGMKGSIIISKSSLQFFAAARGDGAQLLERTNKWNQEKRFSRSYLDKEGDPVLELDLDLAGGVTIARIEDYLTTITKSFLAWMMHLSQ